MAGDAVNAVGTTTKTQRAYEWIKERITEHGYSPGYRLVMGSIASELGMSVVPVREAFRQLEADGLITFEPNVGARVAMVDDSQYRYSAQVVSIVESAATALSARHLTPDDIRQARTVNDLMIRSLERLNPRSFSTLNEEFHAILYSKCPNPLLLDVVHAQWGRLAKLRDSIFAFVPDRARESVVEHEQILVLIEKQAPLDEIEQALRRHRSGTLTAYLMHEHPDAALGLPVL